VVDKLPDNVQDALFQFGEAQFECGDWRAEDADEDFDDVCVRLDDALKELNRVLFQWYNSKGA
jgi:hypothetical protein